MSEVKTGQGAVFFPVSCHATLGRRQFLAGAAAMGLGATVTRSHAADDGLGLIRKHATNADDPWAVSHGVLATGRDFRVTGGRPGVDVLLERFLGSVEANGQSALAFPLEAEAHSNMFLAEALLGPGVPLDHAFSYRGVRRTLADVVTGARGLFRPSLTATQPNLLPWTLITLTRTTPPVRPRWTNFWGEPIDLDALVEQALQALERGSAPVAAAMREGRPLTAQAPVHGFTCGGTHLLYALLIAVDAGYGGRDRAGRLREQVNLLVWRLSADVDLIERFYGPRRAEPAAGWWERDSKLKLLGHAGECLALATRRGLAALTSAQHAARQRAATSVRTLLTELEERSLEGPRGLDRELYRQLVGDTCHARHGLSLTQVT